MLNVFGTLALLSVAACAAATVAYSGSVHAADQFVPGATATATQGSTKVDKHITKDGMVAIMLYASAEQVLTDSTNNRDVLTHILKSLPIGEMSELAGLADTGDDNGQDTGAALIADETEFNLFNSDQKLAAIEQASCMLSALPEKKALLYFSAGVSKTGIDNQAQLEASPAKDGHYRKISVKLNNKQLSAKLEHRPGYYADKVWGKHNGPEKEQQLKDVLSAGNPVTDLPLALQIDYFRLSASSYYVPVSIKIPGSVVALAAKGGAAVTPFDFAGQIQDEQHAVAGNVRGNIKIRLDQGNAAKGRKSFQYDAGFTLEPGKYQMKCVVRENVTGKIGTFETCFTIPDLSADTPGLKLSSAIWSNQREPLQAASSRPEAVPVEVQIPLTNRTPGRYVCQINVVDEFGRKFCLPACAADGYVNRGVKK